MDVPFTLAQLRSAQPAVRNRSTPVLLGTLSPYNYAGEMEVIENPLAPGQYIALEEGDYVRRGVVSRSGDSVSVTITHDPVFTPLPNSWEQTFIRKSGGGVWVEHDGNGNPFLVMMYAGSNAANGTTNMSMGIATSTDIGITWTRYAGNPVFSRPGVENVMLGSVHKIGSTYYTWYSYGDWNPSNSLENIRGIRVATAASYLGPWTPGPVVISGYIEYHQVLHTADDKWALVYEDWIGAVNADYSYVGLRIAYGDSPTGPWTADTSGDGSSRWLLLPSRNLADWDGGAVATPGIFSLGDGTWFVGYQGTNDDLRRSIAGTWDLGVAVVPIVLSIGADSTERATIGTTHTGTVSDVPAASVDALVSAAHDAAYHGANRLTVSAGPVVGGVVTLTGSRVPGSAVYVSG